MACARVRIALGLHGAGFAKPYAFGWRRVGRVSVHLVEIVRSNTVGRLGVFVRTDSPRYSVATSF
jgi:hypothetical protein